MDVTPYIVAIISVTLSLAAITVSTSINPAKRDNKENDNKYKFSKPSVPPPLPFSGETKDWPQWKRQTRCTMGMVGVQKHKVKCLLVENSFMNLTEFKNSLFQRPSFTNTCCHKEDIIWG